MATKQCKTAWVRYQHKFGLFLWTKHFAGTSESSQGTTAISFKIDHGHFDHCNFHIYSIPWTPNQLKRFLDPGHTCIERSLVSSSTKYFSKAFRRFRTWELRTCDTWKLLWPLSSVMFSYQFTCKNSISNNHIYIKYFQKKSVFNYPTLHHSQEETYHGIWNLSILFSLAPTHAAFHDDSAHFGGAWPNVPERRRGQGFMVGSLSKMTLIILIQWKRLKAKHQKSIKRKNCSQQEKRIDHNSYILHIQDGSPPSS